MLCVEQETEKTIIKSKLALIGAAVLLVICMAIYFPFPSNYTVSSTMQVLSFPVQNQDGIMYLGIIGALLFILALIFLVMGLNKYKVRFVVVVIIVYSLLPNLLISVYQNTFARGIQSISYDGEGFCDYEYRTDKIMRGECQFTLENHSKNPVSFELEFVDSSALTEVPLESLMNFGGTYKITLEPKEVRTIEMDETMNVPTVPKQFDSAGVSEIHFKLIDGTDERVM